ncbi:hypothetical protein BDB13_0870 [Rhodococcus sp. OK302]|nr:hypothetical protein BDB13_0870 [Rhodococcus sp. OK302]
MFGPATSRPIGFTPVFRPGLTPEARVHALPRLESQFPELRSGTPLGAHNA